MKSTFSIRPIVAALTLAIAFALGTLTGCASQVPVSEELLNSTLWMQTSAEHQALCYQAYAQAADQLEQALADPNWTAAIEQTGDYQKLPPAMILDLDETVLDNSPFQARLIQDRRPYDGQFWSSWVGKAEAQELPGAVAFIHEASQHGVAVFFVTNRHHRDEAATRANLEKLGLPLASDYDNVLTKGENKWSSDKSARRAHIAGRYRILLLIGDNLGDFASVTKATLEQRRTLAAKYADYWGCKWIVLPNPMYGSWHRALYDYDGRLDATELRARCVKHLRPFENVK